MATGRIAGFMIQFMYGPLINQNRLSFLLGIASLFAIGGVIMSCQTTDTTNVDLQDHWDFAPGEKNSVSESDERPAKRVSFAASTPRKYFSIG